MGVNWFRPKRFRRFVMTENLSITNELPIALDKFIQTVGITDTTAWRWRKKGWLETANIAGRVYVTPEAAREFNRRMLAGEYAKKHVAPKKKKKHIDA